jgi:hypothetical protein
MYLDTISISYYLRVEGKTLTLEEKNILIPLYWKADFRMGTMYGALSIYRIQSTRCCNIHTKTNKTFGIDIKRNTVFNRELQEIDF